MIRWNQLELSGMAVMNITPDSFSDGNQLQSLQDLNLRWQQMAEFCHWMDIGGQSTAPQNQSIGEQAELQRWQLACDWLDQYLDQQIFLSIDTYRPQVMHQIYQRYQKTSWHWLYNDVSGDYQSALQVLKQSSQIGYVASFTYIPNFEQTNDHINFCREVSSEDLERDCLHFFQKVLDFWQQHQLKNPLYLDPAFGFSKKREQNYQLIKALPQIMKKLNHSHWLLGLSRKSFLRFDQDVKKTELMQLLILSQFFSKIDHHPYQLILRVHQSDLIQSLKNFIAVGLLSR